METWKETAGAYLRSRRAVLEPQTTAGYYRHILGNLAAFLDDADLPVDGATLDAIVAGVEDWLAAKRWAASTRCTNLGIVRPFFAWAARRGLAPVGVAEELPNPRRPDPLPRALSVDQVNRLLAAVPDLRGRVIVLLEFQCGLRRAEVAHIDLADLNLADGTVLINGKGRVQRVAYLSDETIDAIRIWMVERGPGPGALICAYNRPGGRMTPIYIGRLVAGWMTDAGIKTRPRDGVSGHALRHACATKMLRDGTNVRVVQRAMGHRSLMTTARYLRADDDEVRAAMAAVSTGTRRLRPVEGCDAG